MTSSYADCHVDDTVAWDVTDVSREGLADRRMVGSLTREEMEALLAGPDRTAWAGRRDHALLLTLYNTGARVSELVALHTKRVSTHVIRHTTAMHLLQCEVDPATIALWLGHERVETTHIYVEADLAMKERALEKLAPLGPEARRFKTDDELLRFLTGL